MITPIRALMTRSEGDGKFVFTFVTEGVKGDGLDLKIDGMRIDDYLTNPVVLWAHDYWGERLPVGKTVGIKRFKTKAKARVIFDMGDPFAAEIARKYEEGFLNTVSVGWDILQMDDDRRTVTDWNVLDISAVPVPGDPKALVDRQKAALRSIASSLDPDDSAVQPGVSDPDLRAFFDDDEGGEWITPPQRKHEPVDEFTVREGEGLLAAAVALKEAAQQVIDSHEEETKPKDPPPTEPVGDPPVGDPPVGDPPPVVNPVAEVLQDLADVLGTTEGENND